MARKKMKIAKLRKFYRIYWRVIMNYPHLKLLRDFKKILSLEKNSDDLLLSILNDD
ncbi:MAG: hypothetical protein ACOX08_00845 [Methanobacterium sp.]